MEESTPEALKWDVRSTAKKEVRRTATSGAGSSGSDAGNSGGGGGGKAADGKKGKVQLTQTTRSYLGYEYECPRGCRFMDCGPDKRVQKSGSGYVKGTALQLLRSDMPLFVGCPAVKCARQRVLAQLARLHIMTPKTSTVRFGLVPRIQLRAGRSSASRALVAHTGQDTIWFEPDGLYVVHVPRIFAHEDKAIILPVDVPAMRQNMCLLKNPFFVTNTPA